MKKLPIFAAAAVLTFCGANVHAAGYQLNEYSVTGLGRSFAGAGVVGDDYSALAYNPAGMTLNKQSGVQAGLTIAQLYSKVRNAENKDIKTKMNFGVPLPSAFGQYRINDRMTAGFGIYAPYGLKTRYSRESFLATEGVKSELEVIDFAPAFAFKPIEKLSLGASVIARYIHGKMTNNISTLVGGGYSDFDLDGWTAAWSVGAMYEFTPQTRLGISYKAKSMQTVKGDHKVSGSAVPYLNGTFYDGKASPDLPQSILVSFYHQPTEKWGLSTSVRWTDWENSFKEFTMSSSAPMLLGTKGKHTVQEEWRKSWTVSLGADYYLNENWTLRAGTAYDQSPVRGKKYRTARIPDSDRIWLSAGASYTNGNFQADAGYAHLFMKNSTAENSTLPTSHAYYKSYSNMLGVQVQYKF